MELKYTHGITETTHPHLKKCVKLQPDNMKACEGSHALAIMTEWDEFKTLDYATIYNSMTKPAFVFDGRDILDHAVCAKLVSMLMRSVSLRLGPPREPLRGRGLASN